MQIEITVDQEFDVVERVRYEASSREVVVDLIDQDLDHATEATVHIKIEPNAVG